MSYIKAACFKEHLFSYVMKIPPCLDLCLLHHLPQEVYLFLFDPIIFLRKYLTFLFTFFNIIFRSNTQWENLYNEPIFCDIFGKFWRIKSTALSSIQIFTDLKASIEGFIWMIYPQLFILPTLTSYESLH